MDENPNDNESRTLALIKLISERGSTVPKKNTDGTNRLAWKNKLRNKNHDWCNGCSSKEGTLFYCDTCRVSYHPLCMEPPLHPIDARFELWHCIKCVASGKQWTNRLRRDFGEDAEQSNWHNEDVNTEEIIDITDDSQLNNCVKRECIILSPETDYGVFQDNDGEIRLENEQNEVDPLADCFPAPERYDEVPLPSCSQQQTNREHGRKRSIGDQIRTIFNQAISDNKETYPKEFVFPEEMLGNFGHYLQHLEKVKDVGKEEYDTVDGINLPVPTCFHCKKKGLFTQMIQCDFCQEWFHMSCLNPPICYKKEYKWMCPLHPHHAGNMVLRNEGSLVEQSLWWKLFPENSEISREEELEIQRRFFENVKNMRKKKQPILEVSQDLKGPTNVPAQIVYGYDERFCLTDMVSKHINNACDYDNKSDATCNVSSVKISVESIMENVSNDQPFKIVDRSRSINNDSQSQLCNFEEMNDAECSPMYYLLKAIDILDARKETDAPCNSNSSLPENGNGDSENNLANVEESDNEMTNVDENVGDEDDDPASSITASWMNIKRVIAEDLESNFYTSNMSADLKERLVIRKIENIIRDIPASLSPSSHPYPLFNPFLREDGVTINKTSKLGLLPIPLPKYRARAALCALVQHAPFAYMYGSELNIGQAFDNEVCTLNYKHCNLIDSHHATIFYDAATNSFELINYSGFGTIVDGVMYSVNLSSTKAPKKELVKQLPISQDDVEEHVVSVSALPSSQLLSSRRLYLIDSEPSSDGENSVAGVSISSREETRKTPMSLRELEKSIKESYKLLPSQIEEDLAEIRERIAINDQHSKALNMRQIDDFQKEIIKAPAVKKATERKWDDGSMIGLPKQFYRQVDKSSITIPHMNKKGEVSSRAEEEEEDMMPKWENVNELSLLKNCLEKCDCQTEGMMVPVGNDVSWERTAVVKHGSHIKIGCLELVFCVMRSPKEQEKSKAESKKEAPLLCDERIRRSPNMDEVEQNVEKAKVDDVADIAQYDDLQQYEKDIEMVDDEDYVISADQSFDHECGDDSEVEMRDRYLEVSTEKMFGLDNPHGKGAAAGNERNHLTNGDENRVLMRKLLDLFNNLRNAHNNEGDEDDNEQDCEGEDTMMM